jgi:hypothetical protein
VGPLLVANLGHVALAAALGVALLALLHLQERLAGRYLAHQLGWRAVLVTGWLGVPVHELAHLAAAKLFGHRIIAWRLFDPDPASGTLGYVRHAYSRRSAWQLLGGCAIGLAPLAVGGLLLAALACWVLSPAQLGELAREVAALPRRLADDADSLAPALLAALGELGREAAVRLWRERSALTPLQLYLAVCIASHMAPSRSDLAGALPGALVAAVLIAGAVVVASALGVSLAAAPVALAPLALLTLAVAACQLLCVSTAALLSLLRPRRARRCA